MSEALTFAVPKGRILDEALPVMARAGVVPEAAFHDKGSRALSFACEGGDMEAFLSLLTDDAVLIFDGGAQVKTAARHPIRGADRVARFLAFVMGRLAAGGHVAPVSLNGGPAALVTTGTGEIIGAVFIEPGTDGNAAEIRWIRNPSKLVTLS